MLRSVRIALLITVFVAIAASPAGAAYAPGCANPADSALNQYCDSIPTPGGQQLPSPSARGLAGTLPSSVARQIERGNRARKALLGLPAATRPRSSGHGSAAANHVAQASASLPLGLYLALAAVALALLAAAVLRWRRLRQSEPDAKSA